LYLSLGKQLDLYGKHWSDDAEICKEVNYMGPCESNYDTFKKYKTALSIENCYLEGYASEKYWTPLQADCSLQRIGWIPDYSLQDCDQYAYAKAVTKHIMEIDGKA